MFNQTPPRGSPMIAISDGGIGGVPRKDQPTRLARKTLLLMEPTTRAVKVKTTLPTVAAGGTSMAGARTQASSMMTCGLPEKTRPWLWRVLPISRSSTLVARLSRPSLTPVKTARIHSSIKTSSLIVSARPSRALTTAGEAASLTTEST